MHAIGMHQLASTGAILLECRERLAFECTTNRLCELRSLEHAALYGRSSTQEYSHLRSIVRQHIRNNELYCNASVVMCTTAADRCFDCTALGISLRKACALTCCITCHSRSSYCYSLLLLLPLCSRCLPLCHVCIAPAHCITAQCAWLFSVVASATCCMGCTH